MTTYYSNHDLSAYKLLVADFNADYATWVQMNEDAQRAYEDSHAAWVENPDYGPDDPMPEPQPPVPPPPPVAPSAPSATYDGVRVDTARLIDTATGQALVTPGRYVLTPSDASGAHALSAGELAADYTDTTIALPT
jgi:hypothetical protein